MTKAKPIIPLVTATDDYPIPLCDRFGYFSTKDDLDRFWMPQIHNNRDAMGSVIMANLEGLRGQYAPTGDDADIQVGSASFGDPRRFLAEDMTFVAFYKGAIGIHAEFETGLNDIPEEMAPHIERFQKAMEPLDSIYPHTRFFLAAGDMTYDNRLTLNAFTPLKNGRLGRHQLAPSDRYLMISPYHAAESAPSIEFCVVMAEIVETLIKMGVENYSAVRAVEKARQKIRASLAA